MTILQKQYENETNLESEVTLEGMDSVHSYTDEYVEWLESKVHSLQIEIDYIRVEQSIKRQNTRGEQGIYG